MKEEIFHFDKNIKRDVYKNTMERTYNILKDKTNGLGVSPGQLGIIYCLTHLASILLAILYVLLDIRDNRR